MKIFKLPDLGEGLPDAIIRQWHVKPGDAVEKDQVLVSVETAKALVEVPAPFDGVIEKCFGDIDETLETGAPLIGFEGEADKKEDAGTVVGKIEQTDTVLAQQSVTPSSSTTIATPAVRALARQLNVDLSTITPKGTRISAEEVKAAATENNITTDTDNWQPLTPIKRAMMRSMQKAHHEVVSTTIYDDADMHDWTGKQDITLRIIRAIVHACKKEPALNALFHAQTARVYQDDKVNLGLAVDMPHGLFVPVIKDVAGQSDAQIRETINRFKAQAQSKSLPQDDLKGATIVLSNFGVIAGKYATPIIVPPTVAIIGVGRLHQAAVPDQNGELSSHRIMPISLSFDHRAITGGEAARFLGALISHLSLPTGE